jgi:amidase
MEYANATAQLTALRRKEVGSLELVDAAIARIEKLDGALNAVVIRDFEKARAVACRADQQRAKGKEKPLLGLPMTVKEAFDVEGLPTSWGLPGRHRPASADAVAVQRLRSAGAVILGKTNVATMLADWQTANPVHGATANPWDPARTPGGSSGGAAAALASGMVPLEFGSDLAGSLRIPAAFCGVYAHRPSHGLVPMRDCAPPMAPRGPIAQTVEQATIGPMARSAKDLALALDIIAGPDDAEAVAYKLALPPARHASLKDHRVLVIDAHPLMPTAREIGDALVGFAARLERAGCKVAQGDEAMPDLAETAHLFRMLMLSFMGADMPQAEYDRLAPRARKSGGEDLEAQGLAMSHRDWILLDRRRLEMSARWRRLFDKFDIVLAPVAPVTAFPHDDRPFAERSINVDGKPLPYKLMPLWTSIGTPTGQPATAFPIGLDQAGLPIGIQAIGPRLEDRTPIAFAALVEEAFGGFVAPPAHS